VEKIPLWPYLGIASTGKVWTITSWHPAEIDLNTLALVYRTDSGLGGVGCGSVKGTARPSRTIVGIT
jgi:hypothetical protein